ncbi:helix-turn-helix domain-containing protein [Roseburia sp. 831b]|uniref:helix-turn-helix domain-containing protein n=1 Tax=Roseburia sp. 831b TaxID=1261635 RepID=UPI0009517D86|nr:helix-turn-helix transcriptional regulator [Roseburia sp. 831b]WVK73766.1 helix-turn-helix transcriptional regulator [Roseburia sp. 831b]
MGERIKELRKTLDLTMERFGEIIGVSKSSISNIENGNRNLTERMFKDICREFDVREEWLRTGEGEMFKELSRSEKIAVFLTDILKDEDDSFRKQFIEAFSELDLNDWKVLEGICNSIIEKRTKKRNQD